MREKKTNNSLKPTLCIIFLCVLAIISLCSCELIMEAKYGKPTYSKVNILVYGNDYYYKPSYQGAYAGHLLGTINDATQIGLSFEAWAKQAGLECEARYVTGKDYTKKGIDGTISYVPEDKSDHDTSKTHFKAIMSNLAQNSQEGELTIFYFSCHGYNTTSFPVVKEYGKARNTAFIMCANSGPNEECELYWHSEFKEELAKIKGAKLVLADVCYAGGLVDAGNVSVNPAEYEAISAQQLFWTKEVNELANTFCLASSRYYELSYESSNRGHGLFTASLLKALCWDEEEQKINVEKYANGAFVSKALSFFSLSQYIVKDLDNYKSYQNPMLSSGSNDLILFQL